MKTKTGTTLLVNANIIIFLKQILKMTMILGVLEVIQNLILKLVVLVVIAIEV